MSNHPLPIEVHPLDPADTAAVQHVVARMRATLVEVLGAGRAAAVHTDAEIAERLAWHLHPPADRRAAAFVARDAAGACLGHTLVRVEPGDDGPVGLFATSFVEPTARRGGVASRLLAAGEAWMRTEGMTRAATWTDAHNTPLHDFYRAHGYALRPLHDAWVELSRAL